MTCGRTAALTGTGMNDWDKSREQSMPSSGEPDSPNRGPAVSVQFVLLCLILAVALSGIYFAKKSGSDPQVYSNDFNVFYHAAREVLAGRDPYQHSLGAWTPYLYPPMLAVLLVPMASLPLPAAAYGWFLINAVSVAAAAWMSSSLARAAALKQALEEAKTAHTGPRQLASQSILVSALSLLVVVRFVLDNANLGQVNPLVAALAVAHLYLYSKERKAASALALALAVSIKLTPFVLIGYHIARRRWKFAAGCTAVCIGVSAISFAPLGSRAPGALREFVHRTVQNEQGFDLSYPGNQSLRGAVARMSAPPGYEAEPAASESSRSPSDAITLMLSLALLAIAMIASSRAIGEPVGAAPFFCCIVLLSPLSWKAHFIMLILPVVCLVGEAASARGSRRAALIACLVLVLALFNLTSPRVIGLQAAEWADQHSLVFAGAMLTFLASVWTALVRARSRTA